MCVRPESVNGETIKITKQLKIRVQSECLEHLTIHTQCSYIRKKTLPSTIKLKKRMAWEQVK